MKKITLCFILLFSAFTLSAQVGINSTGATPNDAAMLDVASTSKGMLVPRMTAAQKAALNPLPVAAQGLLIYQTDGDEGFYYNTSSTTTPNWLYLKGGTGGGWDILGNAGTTNGTHFIGTTDAQDLDFRINDVIHVRITQKGQIETLNTGYSVFIGEGAGANDYLCNNRNTFVGYQAGNADTAGFNNTANGFRALYSNTFGYDNAANGYQALWHNTTGYDNTANGSGALYHNITGNWNTANGVDALNSNTIGNSNTANGYQALYSDTIGLSNVAIGVRALYKNANRSNLVAIGDSALYNNGTGASGDEAKYNTAVGSKALYSNTKGYENTAYGYQTLYSNTTGNRNTANGYQALNSNITGYYNTALGYYAFYSGGAYNNSTALGYNAYITASNQVRIGNSSVSSIGGYANWTNVSDARFKKDIQENVPGLDFVLKLHPVTYHLDMDAIADYVKTPDSLRLKEAEAIKGNMLQTGFIAQEVEQTAKKLGYDFSGVDAPKNDNDYYGLRYAEFVVPLVKAVQELKQEKDDLNKTVKEQQKMIENQNQKNNEQQKTINDLSKRLERLEKMLEQR